MLPYWVEARLGQAVDVGEEGAGCKMTPVAVPEQVVREASYMALEFRVLELLPFLPLRTAIVVTEKLKPNARALFAAIKPVFSAEAGAHLARVSRGDFANEAFHFEMSEFGPHRERMPRHRRMVARRRRLTTQCP